jgi:hypothetical protein
VRQYLHLTFHLVCPEELWQKTIIEVCLLVGMCFQEHPHLN